jgi:hypothetical protein
MYAVLDVHFAKRVHEGQMLAALAPRTDLLEAIEQSEFSSEPAPAHTAIYSHMSRAAVLFILPQGDQSWQVHIECILARGSITELKRQVEKVLRALNDAAAGSSQKIDEVGVAIYSEENRITEGAPGRFLGAIGNRLRDTVIGDVLLAVTPVPITLAFGLDARQAAISALGAALALVVWFAIEAGYQRGAVIYADL